MLLNVSDSLEIVGLEKLPMSRGHLIHCISSARRTINEHYDYAGPNVQKGTALIRTDKGVVHIEFDMKDGWARKLSVRMEDIPMFTKTYKLTGITPAGHFDSTARLDSFHYDFTGKSEFFAGVRIIDFKAIGNNGELRITRPTEADCDAELEGQLSDGFFENWNIDSVEAISE